MSVSVCEIGKILNIKPHYGKYRMWHSVPFIGNTAFVIDETVPGGGQRLIHADDFPDHITNEYIIDAIHNNAFSIGALERKRTGGRIFTPWYSRKTFPSGYYTHSIGKGSSGN